MARSRPTGTSRLAFFLLLGSRNFDYCHACLMDNAAKAPIDFHCFAGLALHADMAPLYHEVILAENRIMPFAENRAR